MLRNQGALPLLVNLDRDTPAAKTLGITHHHDLTLYISFEESSLLMNQATEAFVKDYYKPTSFHKSPFHGGARRLLGKPHFRHLKQDKEEFPAFALFCDPKIQQTELVSQSNMSLPINTVCIFDCNVNKK